MKEKSFWTNRLTSLSHWKAWRTLNADMKRLPGRNLVMFVNIEALRTQEEKLVLRFYILFVEVYNRIDLTWKRHWTHIDWSDRNFPGIVESFMNFIRTLFRSCGLTFLVKITVNYILKSQKYFIVSLIVSKIRSGSSNQINVHW